MNIAISADSSAAPTAPSSGIDGVRQPGVGSPRPPERGQDEHAPADPGERRIAGEQRRYLGESEHEDEIEEELERRDAVCMLDHGRRHARSVGLNLHVEDATCATSARPAHVDAEGHGPGARGRRAQSVARRTSPLH
jgi:hypothetical protein